MGGGQDADTHGDHTLSHDPGQPAPPELRGPGLSHSDVWDLVRQSAGHRQCGLRLRKDILAELVVVPSSLEGSEVSEPEGQHSRG